ncbi:hypothetical protein A4H97_32445 [Niastella yeongjuensis]|uniref:Uncharacterized protein n=1 Tax=Niastella yeongjuensis TaxID=354355 RepID=A0A1V9EHT9_9BACT|nr:hypothetical protein [Niastella yeongjuensis]OQP45455.1 hypothetical protein A4H97_32445 [Niastella yeongjuensis]SEO76411.1 hypothetical protein SAMN05660816_03460 [Niastella yeongjuensis]
MRVVLTNLSNELFLESRLRLNASARQFGIPEVNSYDIGAIRSTPFYAANKAVLDNPRGLGYWLWKPYIILETMNRVEEGDIVVYSDSGIEFTAPLDPLIELCVQKEPVVLFANGNLRNSMWTKRDCFILMNLDRKKYWRGIQCDGSFALFRKSRETIQFLNEFLTYCCDERIISDMPNTMGKKNLPDFIEHRHDQSILSLLACHYQLPYYRIPTQYGNHYKMPAWRVPGEFNQVNQYLNRPVDFYAAAPFVNSPYGQLLDHHRLKKGPAAKAVKSGVFANLPVRIKRKVYHSWVWIDEHLLNG